MGIMSSSLKLSHQSAVDTISQWRAKPDDDLIFDSGRRDVSQYFEAVDRLLLSSGASRDGFNAELLSIAMARLLHEFTSVLTRHSDLQSSATASTTESTFVTDSTAYLSWYEKYVAHYPPTPNHDAIDYLKYISQRMSSSGNLADCVDAYRRVRRNFLQGQLKRLRFEELTAGRHTWDELRLKMEQWAEICKICVTILFEKEKKLCDDIFQSLILVAESKNVYAKDECFVGTVQDSAFSLFSFLEAITNQPYDRMENVFGVYIAFVFVLPKVDALFDSQSAISIKNKCSDMLARIQHDAARMLHDLQNAILNEIPTPMDDQGSVHQSTTYVMDKIATIQRNKELLQILINSAPTLDFGSIIVPQDVIGDINGRSFLDMHVILIVAVLHMNIDSKGRAHRHPTLGNLFIANNVHHILRKIEDLTGLRGTIGDSYVRKLTECLKAALDSYVGSMCARFELCFEDKGLQVTRCFESRVSRREARKRLRRFKSAYEELWVSRSWRLVRDPEMMNEVRARLHEKVAPTYFKFVDRLSSDLETRSMLEESKVSSIFQELFEE